MRSIVQKSSELQLVFSFIVAIEQATVLAVVQTSGGSYSFLVNMNINANHVLLMK